MIFTCSRGRQGWCGVEPALPVLARRETLCEIMALAGLRAFTQAKLSLGVELGWLLSLGAEVLLGTELG